MANNKKAPKAPKKPGEKQLKMQKGIYVNREYAWLKFDLRVLEQSMDEQTPLLERGKFLSIFCSNMDEFFMVRMGSMYNDDKLNPAAKEDKTGLTPGEQIKGMAQRIARVYDMRERAYVKLRADLAEAGINLLTCGQLSSSRKDEILRYFKAKVLPLLSPMVIDAKHPLFRFENKACYMVYRLKKAEHTMIGVMPFPDKIDALYKFQAGKKPSFITMENVIENLGYLAFPGYTVTASIAIRTTRNTDYDAELAEADTEFNNDFSKYLRSKVETNMLQNVIRLEVKGDNKSLIKFVSEVVGVPDNLTYKIESNFSFKYMYTLPKMLDKELSKSLSYIPFHPVMPERLVHAESIVEEIRRKDLLLRYPYDSMDALIKLLNECADRKDCRSIKITIYRLADHSKIVDALTKASENGIDVTVVIELTARFDEENNLYNANLLKEAGCDIIYGMENYKVHSKILSIVFSEEDGGISYITHLGTGNYNESTAKQYTDLNVITADREIGEDAAEFFRNVAISNVEGDYTRLCIAPKYFKPQIMNLLDREISKAQAGGKGLFIGKMNALTDKEIIDKIVEASCAGVHVYLIIRGMCCLLPEKVGRTDNVHVISIVGRFLEHSRIYCFGEDDDRVMYISSADLMTRNTKKRVEIATPILDKDIQAEIYEMVDTMLHDNFNARKLTSSGRYEEILNTGEVINSQEKYLTYDT
ncbi:MAG: polyphosphate kinase 1 [Clostridia bacterium]|nr:polyphosphate kinase 1 [Clostridia bacterium]